jgi:hypothetical protein
VEKLVLKNSRWAFSANLPIICFLYYFEQESILYFKAGVVTYKIALKKNRYRKELL